MSEFEYRKVLIDRLNEIDLIFEANADADFDEIEQHIRFIKYLAKKQHDLELLGLAAKIEMIFQETFEPSSTNEYTQNYYNHNFNLREDNNYHIFRQAIENRIYSSDAYKIDLSAFQKIIEDNKEKLKMYGLYVKAVNYIDQNAVMMKCLKIVLNKLEYHKDSDDKYLIPSDSDIDNVFEYAKSEIERLCRKYFIERIKLVNS